MSQYIYKDGETFFFIILGLLCHPGVFDFIPFKERKVKHLKKPEKSIQYLKKQYSEMNTMLNYKEDQTCNFMYVWSILQTWIVKEFEIFCKTPVIDVGSI